MSNDIKYFIEDLRIAREKNKQQAKTIKALREDGEMLEDALREIKNWGDAYPLQCFPEPDMKKAHTLLISGGLTLDAVSASVIRHTIKRVVEIATEALIKKLDEVKK